MLPRPHVRPYRLLTLAAGFLASASIALPVAARQAAPAESAEAGQAEAGDFSAVITERDIYNRIYFLASDALRGRDTPSRGLEAAASYLVSEHRRNGLEPAGENGTFYQRFPLSGNGTSTTTADPPNVLAMLPGSDPELRDEYIVLSAHFDHVGVGQPMGNDSIYNGADDNASGTAALLEVARALGSLPEGPRRSVVFAHVSGEEKGLLGSRWFVENPTIPMENVVANINTDMVGSDTHADTVVVIGREYSTLGELVDEVNAGLPELGLVAAPDLWPQERLFFRSDQLNFMRREIPSLFFFTGLHDCYHRPCDGPDFVDAGKAARIARLIAHTVLEMANRDERPEWYPDGLEEVRRMTGPRR